MIPNKTRGYRLFIYILCQLFVISLLVPNLTLGRNVHSASRGHGGRHGGMHGGHGHHHMHHHHMHHHGWHHGLFWHPFGFFVTVMAVTAIVVVASDHNNYHYDNGTYYKEGNQDGQKGYVVVPAPIGAKVPSLPEGYVPIDLDNKNYYYYAGAFYLKDTDGKYVVVQAPVGAVVTYMPDGYDSKTVNDVLYYVYDNIYYQPKSVNGDMSYEVVEHP